MAIIKKATLPEKYICIPIASRTPANARDEVRRAFKPSIRKKKAKIQYGHGSMDWAIREKWIKGILMAVRMVVRLARRWLLNNRHIKKYKPSRQKGYRQIPAWKGLRVKIPFLECRKCRH